MSSLLNLTRFVPLLALMITVTLVTLGTPQVARADSLYDEIQAFQHFMREHPRIAGDLQRDPGLANSSHYLNKHDNLRQFLRNHPGVRRELAVNPGRVFNNSYAWDRRYDPRDNHRYGPWDNRRYEDNHRYDNRRYDDDRRWGRWDWWGRR